MAGIFSLERAAREFAPVLVGSGGGGGGAGPVGVSGEKSSRFASVFSVCNNVLNFARSRDSGNHPVIHQWDVASDRLTELKPPPHCAGWTASAAVRKHANNSCRASFVDPATGDTLLDFSSGEVFLVPSQPTGRNASAPTAPVQMLKRLRDFRVTASTWLDPAILDNKPSSNAALSCFLVGSESGDLTLVRVYRRANREEVVSLLWSTPDQSGIYGIRVEPIEGALAIVIGTNHALYHFVGSQGLENAISLGAHNARRVELAAQMLQTATPLYPQMVFLSGSTGRMIRSRKMVWATAAGVLQAELQIHRSLERDERHLRPLHSSIANKVLIHFPNNEAPLSVNITNHHVLLLYPDRLLIFSQLSEKLVQEISFDAQVIEATSQSQGLSGLSLSLLSRSTATKRPLSATGMARDVSLDCVWITMNDGKIFRLRTENEARDIWKIATALKRFDLAIGMVPLESREHVLFAQAEHFAETGDWDSASRLYARTEKPVESVLLAIGEAYREDKQTRKSLMIDYLIRKLDTIPDSKPSQRTLIASILLELYASQTDCTPTVDTERAHSQPSEFRAFLEDHWGDLDLNTAVTTLMDHGRSYEAHSVCVLWGDINRAIKLSLQAGRVRQALDVLQSEDITDKDDNGRVRAEILMSHTARLILKEPQGVVDAYLNRNGPLSPHLDLNILVTTLVDSVNDPSASSDVYAIAVTTIDRMIFSDKLPSNPQDRTLWVRCLFRLFAERGEEVSAERLLRKVGITSGEYRQFGIGYSDLGFILVSLMQGHFRKLAIPVYSALGLHGEAVELALDMDPEYAEEHTAELAARVPDNSVMRQLWLQIARSRPEDLIGVVKRSRGALTVEDILPLAGEFASLNCDLRDAIMTAIRIHVGATKLAETTTEKAATRAAQIQGNTEKLKAKLTARGRSTFLCGHSAPPEAGWEPCSVCSNAVVNSIMEPLPSLSSNGGTLPSTQSIVDAGTRNDEI